MNLSTLASRTIPSHLLRKYNGLIRTKFSLTCHTARLLISKMMIRKYHLLHQMTRLIHRSEPILTFRFWFLSTFWVVIGCGVSSFYYFKPYNMALTSYAVQLLAWGMGSAMATYLPKRIFSTFGYKWSFNPGPWNAKEHALIVVAYWGSVRVHPRTLFTPFANMR